VVNKTIEIIRGLVRPIIALSLTAAIIFGFFLSKIDSKEFLPIAAMAISWWFSSREKKQ